MPDDVEHRHDVRMADTRGELRLVEEHRDELGVPCELRVQLLDRDGPREAARPTQTAEVNRRHPAMRDLFKEDVPAENARLCCDDSPHVTKPIAAGARPLRAI